MILSNFKNINIYKIISLFVLDTFHSNIIHDAHMQLYEMLQSANDIFLEQATSIVQKKQGRRIISNSSPLLLFFTFHFLLINDTLTYYRIVYILRDVNLKYLLIFFFHNSLLSFPYHPSNNPHHHFYY